MGHTQGFKVRVGVILPKDGRLLMVRQNKRDFWVFPGGTLEPEETLEECAVREILEEANLNIEIERLLYVTDFMSPERHVLDVFFLARYLSGDLVVTTEENIDEMDFFTPEQLKTMRIQPVSVAERVLADFAAKFAGGTGEYLGKYGR